MKHLFYSFNFLFLFFQSAVLSTYEQHSSKGHAVLFFYTFLKYY